MKRVLASYRWRRRLMWLTIAAAVVATAVSVGVIWTNTAPPGPKAAPTGPPLKLDYKAPRAVRLKVRDRTQALAVAALFINTAVARKHVDRSWALAAPELRQGITRSQWDSGQNSIVPFPVAEARWKLQFSDARGIGFTMALFPKHGTEQTAQTFMIGLHTVGVGRHRHWLVDNWQPAPTSGAMSGLASGGGSGDGTVLPSISPRLTAGLGKSKESPIWLLLPVGLLSLIIVIPASVAGLNWYRGRRAAIRAGL